MKTTMISLLERWNGIAARLREPPIILSRLILGIVFAEAGWGKLQNLDRVVTYFTSLGIPAAQIQAPLAAFTEFICGWAMLLGLGVRFAAIPIVVIMALAIATARKDEIETVLSILDFDEFMYLVLALWLLVAGAGALSADRLLARLVGKKAEKEIPTA